jgi:hypothetical protein
MRETMSHSSYIFIGWRLIKWTTADRVIDGGTEQILADRGAYAICFSPFSIVTLPQFEKVTSSFFCVCYALSVTRAIWVG